MSLSPAQTVNRLILSARLIVTDHWPRNGAPGRCPICHHAWPCYPTERAYAYLWVVGEGLWVPRRTRAAAGR